MEVVIWRYVTGMLFLPYIFSDTKIDWDAYMSQVIIISFFELLYLIGWICELMAGMNDRLVGFWKEREITATWKATLVLWFTLLDFFTYIPPSGTWPTAKFFLPRYPLHCYFFARTNTRISESTQKGRGSNATAQVPQLLCSFIITAMFSLLSSSISVQVLFGILYIVNLGIVLSIYAKTNVVLCQLL